MALGRAADGYVTIDLDLESGNFDSELKNAQSKASGFASNVTKILGAIGIATVAKDLAMAGINYNIAMEEYSASFEVLTGSAENAKKMMGELKDYASKTPFELGDLASATQTLMAFGTEQEDVMGILQKLGDVSLGNKEKFNGLALVYGQVSSQGKLMGQDLLQMINQGFNPLQVISEKTGVSMADLKDQMAKGAISADDVAQAFQWATEEGGQFYGGMEKQSKTFSGQMSTLQDNINELAGKSMKSLTDWLSKSVIPAVNNFITDGKKLDGLIDTIKKSAGLLIGVFVAGKSKLMITSVMDSWKKGTDAIGNLTSKVGTFVSNYSQIRNMGIEDGLGKSKSAMMGLSVATEEAGGKMKLFNGAMSALSTAGAVVGIGMLVYQLGDLVGMWDAEISKEQESINKSQEVIDSHLELKASADELAKSKASEMDYYSDLADELSRLTDENGKVKEGYEDRVGFITGELSKATGLEIEMVDGVIQNYDELKNKINEVIQQKRAQAIIDAHADDYADAINKESDALKEVNKTRKDYNELLNDREGFIKENTAQFINQYTDETAAAKKAEALYEDTLEDRKDAWDKASEAHNGFKSTINENEQAMTAMATGEYDKINQIYDKNSVLYAYSLAEKQTALKNSVESEISELEQLEKRKSDLSDEDYRREKEKHEALLLENQMYLFSMTNQIWANTPQYAEATAYLAEMGAAAFDENGDLTQDAQDKIDDLKATAMADMPAFAIVMQEYADAGKSAFDENGNLVEAAQKKLIDAMVASGLIAPQYSSILKGMAENGQQVFDQNGNLTQPAQDKITAAEGVYNAITNREKLKAAGKTLGDKGSEGFKSADFTSAGQNAVDGAKKGMGGVLNLDTMWRAGAALAEAAQKGFNQKNNSHSPSRAFIKFSGWVVDGATLGIKNKTADYKESLAALAEAGANEFNKVLDTNVMDTPVVALDYGINGSPNLADSISKFKGGINAEMRYKLQAPVQNINNTTMINNFVEPREYTPSEIAQELQDAERRKGWNV